jgi:hypothetical protein
MLISFKPTSDAFNTPCGACDGAMRLVGIEPHVKTNRDIWTYQCLNCELVQVTDPRPLH